MKGIAIRRKGTAAMNKGAVKGEQQGGGENNKKEGESSEGKRRTAAAYQG